LEHFANRETVAWALHIAVIPDAAQSQGFGAAPFGFRFVAPLAFSSDSLGYAK
jgi:hypothetical protein